MLVTFATYTVDIRFFHHRQGRRLHYDGDLFVGLTRLPLLSMFGAKAGMPLQ